MRPAAATLLLLMVMVITPLGRAGAEHGANAFQVIVHPANPAQRVERKFLSDAFLKRVTKWPDGETIWPVDLAAGTLRARFVEVVMNKPLTALRMHWQQVIFSGRGVPPPELDSEEAVIRYVLRFRGGIGYVTATANVAGAKAIALSE